MKLAEVAIDEPTMISSAKVADHTPEQESADQATMSTIYQIDDLYFLSSSTSSLDSSSADNSSTTSSFSTISNLSPTKKATDTMLTTATASKPWFTLSLGPLEVQPIETVMQSSTTTVIESPVSLHDMIASINQLVSVIHNHIAQTITDITALRS